MDLDSFRLILSVCTYVESTYSRDHIALEPVIGGFEGAPSPTVSLPSLCSGEHFHSPRRPRIEREPIGKPPLSAARKLIS
jgi:hypothetical protein